MTVYWFLVFDKGSNRSTYGSHSARITNVAKGTWPHTQITGIALARHLVGTVPRLGFTYIHEWDFANGESYRSTTGAAYISIEVSTGGFQTTRVRKWSTLETVFVDHGSEQ